LARAGIDGIVSRVPSHTSLLFHAIIGTRGRAPTLSDDLRPRLFRYIGGILRNIDSVLLDANGVEDHVHLLISLHPSHAVAEALRLVKANSSKWVHETFPAGGDFWWQDRYAAFSVSTSGVPALRRYIARQREHHRRVSFKDELEAFFRRHGIRYDPEHIVD
jgi:REP element-mobilizing transposase RayT